MDISIDALEHAAAPGWRATEEERLGDWLLRAAGGFTGRANSALAAGDAGLPARAAVDRVVGWYADRGLPAMIAIPYPAGQPGGDLDGLLASLGWTIRADAATVMIAEAADVVAAFAPARFAAADVAVEFAAAPADDWLERYHYRGGELPPVARALLVSAPWQEFASVRDDRGVIIAVGRVAGAGDWAGLTAIEVDPRFRGRGLGAAVTAALTARAAATGYGRIYLQVTDDNGTARALYRRLGFRDHHGYHYRVAPPS